MIESHEALAALMTAAPTGARRSRTAAAENAGAPGPREARRARALDGRRAPRPRPGAGESKNHDRIARSVSGFDDSRTHRGATEQNRTTTTGQGAASGSAKLSTEQRTKITTIFKQHKVEPTKLSVSVSVGTRIPTSVHLYPIPVQVVEVYPEWRGFNYILVGDQIIVVNPRTHEIVAILEA